MNRRTLIETSLNALAGLAGLLAAHSSGFDYAGRVTRGPAPLNLPVPPHRHAGPTKLVIGEPTRPT
jgi:hypothetical protein